MRYFPNQDLVSRMGVKEPLKVSLDNKEGQDAKPADLVMFLLFNLTPGGLSVQDVRNGGRIFDAIEEMGDGNIFGLEDTLYDWLKKQVEEQAPRLFGMNARRLLDIVDGALKVNPDGEPERSQPTGQAEDGQPTEDTKV